MDHVCCTILILLGIFISRRSEDRRQEVEMLLDTQNETIADLTRRVSIIISSFDL